MVFHSHFLISNYDIYNIYSLSRLTRMSGASSMANVTVTPAFISIVKGGLRPLTSSRRIRE